MYTASNDGSLRIFDLNSNKLIKKFSPNSELFSLDK